MVGWDDGAGILEDPAYGEIRFLIKSWGENAPYTDSFYELDSNFCQNADLNDKDNSNTASNFY